MIGARTELPDILIPKRDKKLGLDKGLEGEIVDNVEVIDISKYMRNKEIIKTRTSFEETPELYGKLVDSSYGTITMESPYGTMKVSVMSAEEELRKVVSAMKKGQIAYRYYSSIWSLCAVALCFFITAGASGLLGIVPSAVGAIFSIVGGVGAVIDWKGWNKKNDNKSFS